MRKEAHKSAWGMLQQYPPGPARAQAPTPARAQAPTPARARSARGHCRRVLKIMLIVVALGVLANMACRMTYDIGHLRETSMLPTIEPGDFLVAQQWGARTKPGNNRPDYQGREAGQTDGETHHRGTGSRVRLPDTGEVHTLLADEYWVTGDNTFDSFDSRAFGPVRRHEIQGVIVFRTGRLRWIWD